MAQIRAQIAHVFFIKKKKKGWHWRPHKEQKLHNFGGVKTRAIWDYTDWYTSQKLWCFASSAPPSATCNTQDIKLLTGTLNLSQAVSWHFYSATTSKPLYFSRSQLANHMVIQTSSFTRPPDGCLASSSCLPHLSLSSSPLNSKNYGQQQHIFKILHATQTLEWISSPFKIQLSSQSWRKSWNLDLFCLRNDQTKPSDEISFLKA